MLETNGVVQPRFYWTQKKNSTTTKHQQTCYKKLKKKKNYNQPRVKIVLFIVDVNNLNIKLSILEEINPRYNLKTYVILNSNYILNWNVEFTFGWKLFYNH